MTTNLSPLRSKFSSTDILPLKNSNSSYRRSVGVVNHLTTLKGNSLLNTATPQEIGSYTISPKQSQLNVATQKKSPVKSLVIDTNDETSKFNNSQNSYYGSYTTTHNISSSYSFPKNALLSSLNGNLTTKFSKATDSYKTNFMPATKSLSSGKLLLPSSNFSHPTLSHLSKENISPLTGGLVEPSHNSTSPTHASFKNGSSKHQNLESNKSLPNENSGFEKRHSLLDRSKNTQQSVPQENAPLAENKPSNSSLNRIEPSNTPTNNQPYLNENIVSNAKQNSADNQAPTPTNAKKQLTPIPNHEPTKCSVKRNGIVKAYAANTNQGIVRNYNEDRVSIILNIMKPASRANEDWPKCSFFGVYDGHGGVTCADFLRDNLHQYVIKEPSFPWNPKEALMKGFEAAEKAFLEIAQNQPSGEIDRSGSCAIVVLIIGDMCYAANVGDSRAVLSGDCGNKVFPLSRDHKPNDDLEQKRIIEGGGKIYQTQAPALRQVADGNTTKPEMQFLLGPHRVFPGRLSVSRTFGDIEAKLQKYGGNPNVVIAVPEIKAFKITAEHDFIILASDGIYDKLSSRDVVKSVWESTQEQASNIHHQCGLGVENILREAIHRRTLDNITVVMICFKNFKYKLFPREKSKKSNDESLNKKDTETSQTSNKTGTLTKTHSSTHFGTRASSQNTRLVDKSGHFDSSLISSLHKGQNGRKTPTPLLESTLDVNSVEHRRYNPEKDLHLSDSGLLNKRNTPKRGGSTLETSESQKVESFHRYLHNTNNNTNFKSMDYKTGDMFKFRSYVDNK